MRGIARRVLRDLLGYRRRLVVYGGMLVVAALAGLGAPLLTKILIDDGLTQGDTRTVVVAGLLALALGLVHAAAQAAGQALGGLIGGQLIFDLRRRLYRHLQAMPLAFFARSQSGAVINRVTSDVIEAQGLIQATFGSVVSNAVALIAAVAAMTVLSPPLTLIVLAAAPLVLIPVRRVGRKLGEYGRAQARAGSQLTAFLAERVNVAGTLLRLLFGHQDLDRAVFDERATALRDAVRGRNLTFAKSAFLLTALGVVGYALVYLIGGTSGLTVGTVVAMAGLLKLAYDPLVSFATSGLNVYGGLVAFERVYEVLDFPSAVADPPRPRQLHRPAGTLSFRGVSFRHPEQADSVPDSLAATEQPKPQRTWALRDLTWTAARGTTTAIVGPTGAGKTTLTALVCRLYDPTQGSIELDGTDVRAVALDDLHRAVGAVTQDAYLYNDTLAANLRLGRPGATDDELVAACRQACLGELLDSLDDGLDTVVGDHGYRLSGGERQRVALARVFLQDPDLVVLDEATAHLDSRTEEAVRLALTDRLADRTMIVVAHRLSTIVHADQILVLDAGRIVERGTHVELLASGSLYPALFRRGLPGR